MSLEDIYLESGISPCSSALSSHSVAALHRVVATTLKQKLPGVGVFSF